MIVNIVRRGVIVILILLAILQIILHDSEHSKKRCNSDTYNTT